MFFFFTFGTQDFSGRLKGYEDMVLVCSNCYNAAVVPIKRRNFFTFCFIPIFPIKWTEELRCGKCNHHQRTTKEQLDQIRANPPPLPQNTGHPGAFGLQQQYQSPHGQMQYK